LSDEEIKALIEKARERLDAAHHLLREGFYEDAISRAYYSMYFAAKALLLKKSIIVKTHRGLISKFGLEFVSKGLVEEYYGRALRIAEELREEADYSISRKISEEEAEAVVDDAEKFLNRIVEVLKELNK
jgi:uncharacterized protein (UPF0332 family)